MRGIFDKKLKEERGIDIREIEKSSYNNGYYDGKSDGEYEMQIEIAKKLKKANLSSNEIVEITGISQEVLKGLN